MDGTSTVGPPGPRGPPGRVEVLSSVSIIQAGAWPHAFCFAKGDGRSPDPSGLQGWWLCRVSGPEPASMPTYPSVTPPPHATALLHRTCRVCSSACQDQGSDGSLESTRVLRKPQISLTFLLGWPQSLRPAEKESQSWRHKPEIMCSLPAKGVLAAFTLWESCICLLTAGRGYAEVGSLHPMEQHVPAH